MTRLTEMRKADREAMAAMVEALARSKGATATRVDASYRGPKETLVEVVLHPARIAVEFDGSKGPHENRDLHSMAWNVVAGSGARMTPAFGEAAGAEVNPHHRAKCWAFADGIDELLARLGAVLDLVNAGGAFEATTDRERAAA